MFGLRFWSYDHLPFNLNGRVCLIFSVFWGLAALAWMRVFWPALCALLDRPPPLPAPDPGAGGAMALNITLTGRRPAAHGSAAAWGAPRQRGGGLFGPEISRRASAQLFYKCTVH